MPQNGTGYTEGRFQLATYAKFNRPDPMRDWNWLRPHTMNLYEYVGNDLVNMWDPTGFADDNSHMQWHEDHLKKIVTAPNEYAREQAKHNYEVGKIARGIGAVTGVVISHIVRSPIGRAVISDLLGIDLSGDESNNNDGSGQDENIAEGPVTDKVTRTSRKTEYPSGNRKSVRKEIIAENTDAAGNVRDPETGEIIPSDQVTIEHQKPVVEHYNSEGYNQTRKERTEWYNNKENLSVKSKSKNSSDSAKLKQTYRQDKGPNYDNEKLK